MQIFSLNMFLVITFYKKTGGFVMVTESIKKANVFIMNIWDLTRWSLTASQTMADSVHVCEFSMN